MSEEQEKALAKPSSFPAIEVFRKMFEDSVEAFRDARTLSERDRDFYLGIQWTEKEQQVLRDRGQPVVTSNRIRGKMNTIKGLEIQSRTQPKAWPRNRGDEDAANAATDALRFVADRTKWNSTRTKLREEIGIEGQCYVELSVEFKGDEAQITNRRIPWDRGFIDPHSTKPDGSDARYMGEAIWMDLNVARRRFPRKKDILTDTMATQIDRDNDGETYEDKPRDQVFFDRKRQRIRIIRINYIFKDEWNWAIFTFAGLLSGGEVSPFVDEDGEPWNNILTQAMYIDRDNQRSGIVRDMISPQEEINFRKSKSLHLATFRQGVLLRGSGTDAKKVKAQLKRADGIVEPNSTGDFQILDHNDQIISNLNLLQEAKQEIDGQGPNPALQGERGAGDSGIAIQRQQIGGFTELASYMDAGRDLDISVYEHNWLLIQQFWTEERWIRVTDDENNPRFVGLSVPLTGGDEFMLALEEAGLPPEVQQEQLQRAQQDPRFNQPTGEIENDPAEIDIDIILDETIDLPTLRHEEFQILANLAQNGIPIPPDLLIENSTLRNKDAILERMRGSNPLVEAAGQLDLKEKTADIDKTISETMENQADTALKIKELEQTELPL